MEKESYTVEDVEELIGFARSMPMIASTRVAYVKGFSSITELSQNKLLKELEDNHSFVLVATADNTCGRVLPTIQSRMEKETLSSETKEEFRQSFVGNEDMDILYAMSGGYSLLATEMVEQVPIYKMVQQSLTLGDKQKLFDALHLVADKDNDCYIEKYRPYLPQLFDFMADVITRNYELQTMIKVLEVINKEKVNALGKWYARTDFFTSIVNIAEAMVKKGEC